MSLSTILVLFTSFAIVSTRNVYQVTTSYKYIQSKPSYSDEYKSLSDTNVDQGRITNYEYQTESTHENYYTQREDHVNSNQDLNEAYKKDYTNGPVFTNVNRQQNNINVKYIKRLDEGIDPDIIVFNDNVETNRRPPFTNKRTENNTKHKISVNTDLPIRKGTSSSKLPDIRGSTKEHYITESYSTDRPRTSPKGTNVTKPNVSNSRNNTYSVKETQETTPGFDLEDRVAFEGNKCATGQAKVQGKCVPTQD
ncbi:hypothetical protein RR48_03454 [Papilio machaon]|uniref:Uncharacterized protein n=1 Tax=Papilio machaon TaxID=76193 RepID=A0A0N1IFE4_PAPMA|nr:hypothetical protein RR48_03454 [Papilio machaon]